AGEGGRPTEATGLHLDADGAGYLAAFHPFDIGGRQRWTVVVTVAEAEVLGAVQRNGLFTLWICAGVLLVAIAAGAFLAHQISRPLGAIGAEMGQVEQFVITEPPPPTSAIEEVDLMGRTLDRMKLGLRSFAKYVPADLVRLLHSSGQEAVLGGQ